MTSRVSHTTVHCRDAYSLSEFWRLVLGWTDDPDDPNEAGHEQCFIRSADGTERMLFVEADLEQAPSIPRLHLDLEPLDDDQAAELTRILALGAEIEDDRRRPDGRGWIALRDPEDNQFCLLRTRAEREADGSL